MKKTPTPEKPVSKAKAPAKAKPKPKATPKPKKKPAPKARAPRKPVDPVDRPLTPKMMQFVYWYTSAEVNCNGTEAARRAGYKGTDATLGAVAYENLRKPHIKKLVDQRLAEAIKGAQLSVEKILFDLQQVFVLGVMNKQLGAAVRAKELQGKHLKMFTDKIEHTHSLEEMSTEELQGMLRDVMQETGIDLSGILAGDGPQDSGLSDTAGAEAQD